jgi:uncharacterized protein involved in exopolysaccharide biosynthesis
LPPPEAHQAFISEAPAQQGMSLTQVITMVRARWKWILIISLTLIVFGAVLIKLLPKTYTATATLIVDSDVKDPLAGRDFRVEAVANYVSTQMELIASPIILVPVIERLGLTEDKAFTAGFAGSPEALRESVQKNLLTALTVERGTGGQLIYINVSNKNAARAAQIANAIADVFLEQDRIRRNGPARERAQRYTEELAELREKAIVAQDKVTEFRKAHGLDDLNQGSADSEVQALDTLHARLLETQNMRRSLESKAASAKAANTASGSPQTLREQLQNELSQLDQLKGVYGPQHPRIRELEAQIAATRASLGDEERSLSGTRELERKYQAAIAEQEAKVLNLREAQDEGGKLLLELESAKSVYKQALDGFDQILFQSVANQTNVSIVSHAVAPLRASKPNKMKLMLMVLAAGLWLGVCGPLGYELLFDRRLRCRDDMEREFGIPVIAQLEPVAALRHA